jgi:hypothetical protein
VSGSQQYAERVRKSNDLRQGNQASLLCTMSITHRIIRQQYLTTRLPGSQDAVSRHIIYYQQKTTVLTDLFPIRLLTNRQHANSLAICPPFSSDQLPREFKNLNFKFKMAVHSPNAYYPTFGYLEPQFCHNLRIVMCVQTTTLFAAVYKRHLSGRCSPQTDIAALHSKALCVSSPSRISQTRQLEDHVRYDLRS